MECNWKIHLWTIPLVFRKFGLYVKNDHDNLISPWVCALHKMEINSWLRDSQHLTFTSSALCFEIRKKRLNIFLILLIILKYKGKSSKITLLGGDAGGGANLYLIYAINSKPPILETWSLPGWLAGAACPPLSDPAGQL